MILSISGVDVSYGADAIIKDVEFSLKEGEKVAIVGRNGCGKTTLLRLITGELTPDHKDSNTPSIVSIADGAVIGSLDQMSFTDENACLSDEIKSVFRPILKMKEEIDELLHKLDTAPDEETSTRYATLQERFNYLGGYRLDKDYELLVQRFGFSDEELKRPLSSFSGGQRTKIAFIKLLLSKPDILILDEPTNHLDISTISWLEGYLASYRGAVILVSHDRMFIDRIAETVYEIERGKIKRYPGNYTAFAKRKRELREKQQKDYEAQQKEIERLNAVAERFIHKATKASMAKSKLKAIEHMDIIEKPEEDDIRAFHALTEPARESGNDVLETENLAIGYDSVLSKVTMKLKKGQKLGIIGGNGLGKSTFLRTIAGQLPAKGGKYRYGHGVELGYFEQQMARYESNKTVFDEFRDAYPTLTDTAVRNILGGFLFTGDDVFKELTMLSGGEKVRLTLAKIFQERPNLLLLDEPTNHVDIAGKEALEDMMRDFKGSLIFVSHDRYLVSRVADSLLIFTEGKVEYFPFDYEEYIRNRGSENLKNEDGVWRIGNRVDEAPEKKKDDRPDRGANPGKERSKMERRFKRLEELMAECDEKKAALTAELEAPENASDFVKLGELQTAIEELDRQAESYMEEWAEIGEKLEA